MDKQFVKKVIVSALIFSFFILPVFPKVSGETTEIQEAISYLKTQTPEPWQTMALASAGQTLLSLEYLKEVSGDLATDCEKTILALTAAGKNPRTFGNLDFIAKLKTFEQLEQIGSPDLLNDDFWGILALLSAGESPSDSIIQNSKNFIMKNQNSDGGWSYAVSGQSDTNDTAVAIMTLLEAGINLDDSSIIKGINYLKVSQNEDGGFPYIPGSESDSGSDSWALSAIYKLRQKPSDWQKNGKNPIEHLKSLQRTDGSFKWLASEDKGYPVLTAYAVISLTENYYPINRLHHLRIEGKDEQICDAMVRASTALDIIQAGADFCGYTYFIEQTSWGPYLKKINTEESRDLIGWLYFVNSGLPAVGAADYILKPGDEVLWYFGEWGWEPSRLTISEQKVNSGENVGVKVEYFEDTLWKPLTGAKINVSSQSFITDNNGVVNLVINEPGIYKIYAEKSGFIRTEQVNLLVGEGVNKNINLRVEITQPSAPPSPAPEIVFSLSKSQIDLGKMDPGTQFSDEILITNLGNVKLSFEATVEGNSIF